MNRFWVFVESNPVALMDLCFYWPLWPISSLIVIRRLCCIFHRFTSDLQIGVRGRRRVRVSSSEHAHFDSLRRSNLKRVLIMETRTRSRPRTAI